MNKKKSHFQKCGVFSKLLNRVTSVFKNTLVTINVTNFRSCADGIEISRVINS